jgi:hypothetical protein
MAEIDQVIEKRLDDWRKENPREAQAIGFFEKMLGVRE